MPAIHSSTIVLLALVAACAEPVPALRGALAVEELPSHIRAGEPILRLSGGRLYDRSVDVPMWLDLRERARTQSSCEVTWGYQVFELSDDRIYVELSSMCAASVCRILDPTTRQFSSPPGGCIDRGPWTNAIVRRVDEWFIVHASAEGVGDMFVQQYTPEQGSRVLLTLPLETEFERTADGLRFEVGCPRVGGIADEHGGTFDWSPSSGLVRVGERRPCPDT